MAYEAGERELLSKRLLKLTNVYLHARECTINSSSPQFLLSISPPDLAATYHKVSIVGIVMEQGDAT